jgi:molecular chaperone Hsp33
VLDEILSAHDYPAPIGHLLSEALVVTALMGSLLKELDSQLTIQAQTEGGICDLLVCDYRQAELRGYVQHDPDRLEGIGANPSLRTLMGEGYLAITFDLAASDERYQGIVPLEGLSLTAACESYFGKSEQLPTLLRIGVRHDGKRAIGGGLLVQHLAGGEMGRERPDTKPDQPEWEHAAVLADSTRHDELVDPALPLEQLVWRLFHEETEIRVEPLLTMERGCRCTVQHFAEVLAQFPEGERQSMRNEDGYIPVDCAFCSKIFAVAA